MFLELNLKRLRLKQQRKLSETNLYLFKSITIYIRNSSLTDVEKEEILQQILDMLLEAQNQNKTASFVIGKDYEKFCDSIIKEYSSDKNVFYTIFNFFQNYLFYLILTSFFMAALNRMDNSIAAFGINVNQFIIISLVSLIIIPIVKKASQEKSYLTSLSQRIMLSGRQSGKLEVYGLALMAVMIIILKFILGRIYGEGIFSYVITLNSSKMFLIAALFLIVIMEFYNNRFFNKLIEKRK
ncbi:Protein of unknown function [Caloramator quimbayensis]|uniref:DUF1048 domain-containing protein n=1 Tax=Caloramator quimbayensis TaxID=1147123 RepID=A0A1T4Y0M3_9CLOT|nr:DUF1048 domain-containing protein [Caloramator quimbayensis]SKA95374.1 Protein of unknown function [Caloramator quimbayensis]